MRCSSPAASVEWRPMQANPQIGVKSAAPPRPTSLRCSHHPPLTVSSWGEEGVIWELSLGACPAGWGRDTQLLKTFGKLRHRGKWGRNNLWVIAQLFFLRNNPLCNNSFEAILRFYEGLFQDRLHCISRIDLLLCNYQIKVLEEVHFTTKPGWQKFCNWWLPKGQGLLWKEKPTIYAILSQNLTNCIVAIYMLLKGFTRSFKESQLAFRDLLESF